VDWKPQYKNGSQEKNMAVGKFSFVNRITADWNQLPEGVLGLSPAIIRIFSKTVRNAMTMEGKKVKCMYENCCV
jgi:hypothetical protein